MNAEEMSASEVRSSVLKDHAELRKHLDRIDDAVSTLQERGGQDTLPLLEMTETLFSSLTVHMAWEETHLARVLREADAWGPEREARLLREHAEQREMFVGVIARLRALRGDPTALADELRGLVHLIREDMSEEEFCLLDPNVLRDDVVGIEVEAG